MTKMNFSLFIILIAVKAIYVDFIAADNFYLEDETCWGVFTCDLNQGFDIPPCYCDTSCTYYMDCCKEYLSQLNHSSFLSNTDPDILTEVCEPLLTNPLETERVGAFMINICSDDYCEISRNNFDLFLPVSTKTTTYRNANCARCNGVHDFEYWRVYFEIQSGDISLLKSRGTLMKIFFNASHTPFSRYIFHPPIAFTPRFCYPTISKINSYQAPITSDICSSTVFRNIDECIEKECCRANELHRCRDLFLPDYPEYDDRSAEYIKNIGIKPLQILINPTQVNDRVGKAENFTLKIRYKEMVLVIKLNIRMDCHRCSSEENQHLIKASMGNCFMALLILVGETKYKPVLNWQSFKLYELEGNSSTSEQSFFIMGIATPTVSLSPEDLDFMMRFTMSFSCYNTKSGFESVGTVIFLDDTFENIPHAKSITTESNVKIEFINSVENCQNISIKIDEKDRIKAECMREADQRFSSAVPHVETMVWKMAFLVVYIIVG